MANSLVIAESWDKIYKAFENISFVSYDYDTIRQSLLDTLKFNYPENFNDYIESSIVVALIESFSHVAEQLAYRIDLGSHENFISSVSKKQNILKLARLVSYSPSRNTPLSGLVKIDSVSCSENFTDSQGNNLTNREIKWGDSTNILWKEQFNTVLNKILNSKIGNPLKSFQVEDNLFQQYEVSNVLETDASYTSFKNGTLTINLEVSGQSIPFEIIPADIDEYGVIENDPNPNNHFKILYSNDGFGDNSKLTGYMMYLRQGVLSKVQYVFDNIIPNRVLDINIPGINDTDVWVYEVDGTGNILNKWEKVDNTDGNNLHFNTISSRKKYEISTLEDDKIRLVFGDGDYSEIPSGIFNIWVRSSFSDGNILEQNKVSNKETTFSYVSKSGTKESCTFKYSLTNTLQNSTKTEDIEHIRDAAPKVYHSQNRMSSAQDYNEILLKEQSILKLKAVNRTFAGQSKYLTPNDPSGSYQNVKLFGDDLKIYFDEKVDIKTISESSRTLIDNVLEKGLKNYGIQATILNSYKSIQYPFNNIKIVPRNVFIENSKVKISGIPLQEKNELQGVLDRHYYGEHDKIVLLDSNLVISNSGTPYALISNDSDGLIYESNFKLVKLDSSGNYTTVDNNISNTSGLQDYVSRQKRFGIKFNPIRSFSSALRINDFDVTNLVDMDILSTKFVNPNLVPEDIYIEIIDDLIGKFSVNGVNSGFISYGTINEVYNDGNYKFIIGSPVGTSTPLDIGDTFYISVEKQNNINTPTGIYKANTTGRFEIISELLIQDDTYTKSYDVLNSVNSWIYIIQRNDDLNGNFLNWTLYSRDLKIVAESVSTRFFVDKTVNLVDSETKKPVRDVIKVLKSNLNSTRLQAIGIDQEFNIINDIKYSDGSDNLNAVSIIPTSTYQFIDLLSIDDYVYFEIQSSGKLKPLKTTDYLKNLVYVNNINGNYTRKIGRSEIDFLWQHFTDHDRLIDPSPTNINDIYVITKSYYESVDNYLRGISQNYPVPPTSLELRNLYRNRLNVKMMSDTVVMHSGSIKFLFGKESIPELRASFKIIRNPNGDMTDDQIRTNTVDIINEYFKIKNWDFGKSLYITELISLIHKSLATNILSVVMTPTFSNSYYGDLLIITPSNHEILHSCATIDDIVIVDSLSRSTIRQF